VILATLFVGFVVARFALLVQARNIGKLEDVSLDGAPKKKWPSVSVVVAARNEADGITEALASLLRLDYDALEVIVVNDRSTDQTADQVRRLAATDSRLRLIEVSELPSGWLGKNHALQVGFQAASGEWILFTDADVVFSPRALRKAIVFVERESLDHLALLMKAWSRSFIVDAFIAYFGLQFLLFVRPWEAKDPQKLHRYVGVGAFNLVRSSALQSVEGLGRIAMRPDDDVKLGKVLKQAGCRQDCLTAVKDLSVEWYPSLGACIRGLEKNMFAGTDYRVSLVMVAVVAGLLVTVLPLYLLLSLSGALWWTVVLALVLEFVVSLVAARRMAKSLGSALLAPLTALLFSYIAARTTIKNLRDGGIYWRDTFYPLSELRKNRV
jgi:cellulose synthase/poly-beta-1,6-N-acetylglucosamine synthase-like glycosyltransferase